MGSELSGIFWVNIGTNNIAGSSILGDQTPGYFCSAMSLFEETYTFSELNCFT